MTASPDPEPQPPPILRRKDHGAPSVFTPDALLREARRQKTIELGAVPEICILDPDGDVVRHLVTTKRARRLATWACYHTNLYAFEQDSLALGVVGRAIGAAFAVLVAEELFASGCRLLISITSAGQILPIQAPPYFIIIDRALRDEGTSYHHLPPTDYSTADAGLVGLAKDALTSAGLPLQVGPTWTSDAPFRETSEAIAAAREASILAVEMEAAARYAKRPVSARAVLAQRWPHLVDLARHQRSHGWAFDTPVVDRSDTVLIR